ncbi:MAG: MlaD family protein [Syntrophales bacterium]|nr:MlaD family protein [Syntrophales bacterium]MDD5533558.1 MlaD family protein [Syntrophales bacterium]
MSKPANKKLIGLFVIGATGLLIGAVLMAGLGRWFGHYPKYVMYFDSSVKGLSVGAPVVFRGVNVGAVTGIDIDFNPADLSVLTPVYVELGGGKVSEIDLPEEKRTAIRDEIMSALILKGLRAQLEMQSVLTGQLLISLEFHPGTAVSLKGGDKRYLEIPTVPTEFQQLTKRIEDVPIEEILMELRDALAGINRVFNSPETAKILASGSRSAEEARVLLDRLESRVDPLADRTGSAIQQIDKLAAGMNTEVPETLKELREAARSIRALAEELRERPQSIFWGKKRKR